MVPLNHFVLLAIAITLLMVLGSDAKAEVVSITENLSVEGAYAGVPSSSRKKNLTKADLTPFLSLVKRPAMNGLTSSPAGVNTLSPLIKSLLEIRMELTISIPNSFTGGQDKQSFQLHKILHPDGQDLISSEALCC